MPNKFVVFNGTDQNNLESLWITDGTSAGTSELSVTGASANGLNPTGFTQFGSEVAFEGTDASGQNGLWVTDGTSAGTSELSVSGAASGGLNPQNMAGLGNELLFEGTDAAGNNSLWVTNGTSAGTSELSITGAATTGLDPQGMAVFGSEVLFSGVDSNNHTNLWLTDGTAVGTSELQVAGTFPPGLIPQDLTPFGTNVLFNGVDQSGFSNLWVTDGTGAGTSELSVAGAAASGLNPLGITVLGSKALFEGVDASGQTNLWVTDGTAAGTSELSVANAYSGGLNPFDLTVLGNNVFFEGEDSSGNYGLWKTDGTAAGTSELAIGTPGYNIYLASNGKDVLFNGDYNLWVTDGTSAGTSELSAAGASPELAPTFITSVAFPVSAATSTLVATPGSVTADGVSTSTLTVTVEDSHGNAVADTAVTLSGSGTANSFGTISGTTNANGVFTTTLASTLAQTETITATEGSVHETTSVTFNPGAPSSTTSTLVASPGSATADGVSTTTLTVTVEDALGNLVPNAAVTLSGSGTNNSFGTISGTTNANGVLTTTLASTVAQTETITATEGGVHESTSVTFNPGAPSATTSTLVASPGSATADGVSTTTLTVTVEDAHGNLVPNAAVTLSGSGTANSFGTISGTTNANGVFTTTLASTLAQTETITATEGSVHETTSVTFNPGAPSATTSTLVASPGSVTADGVSTTTLTVTVEDAQGNLVPNAAVTLSGSGTANSFGTISGTTNANGVFTTTLASTLAQTETITATEGSVHETTSVTFNPGAPSSTTSTLVASPGSATADGVSTTTLTVTVEDALGNLVPNAAVTLSGSGTNNSFGTISGTTNANGVLTTTLASTVAQTETITATEGGVHESTSVTFNPGAPSATTSTLVASPGSATADGVSTTTLTVTVEDAQGNLIPNAAVTLSGSGTGDVFGQTSGTTNAQGVFTTTLSSTTAQAADTITATEGSVHETTSVTFNPGAPSATTSTLVASPGSVKSDGLSTTTLTVTVEDANGNPVVGTAVTLAGGGTANSFGALSGTTNANGVFTTTLASTVAQTETITATEGGVQETASVTFNRGAALQPDLSEYVAVSSTTVAAGGSVTIDAYDMNLGNAVSGPSTARIYLSTDPTITTSDTVLATLTTSQTLATVSQPGYYDHQTVSVTLPGDLAPGTYYIGGIADYNNQVSESNEVNNTYNVAQITVTVPQPDLSEYVAVSSTTVAAGGSVTLDAYDMNLGNAVSGPSTAQIYLSTDPTITTSDTVLATLTTSQTLATVSQPGYYDHQTVSVTLPGDLAPGTYYIGGIADYNNQVSESNEANNTYNVTKITVTAPPQPDLSEYVAVSSTTVAAGGSVTLDAYDMNLGNAVSGPSTAQIYLSTDPTITTSDTVLATLTTSQTLATVSQPGYYDHQTVSVTLPGDLAPGTYYIGGIADYNNQVSESNEANNTYNVTKITVTAPPQPDLSEYVAVSSTTVAAGGSVTLDAYDMNLGNAVSGPSTAQIYLSTVPTITTSDTVLATLTTSQTLATVSQPGYYDHQTVAVTLPGNLAPGTYYIGGIADYNNQVSESNEANNTYNVTKITVTAPNPGPVMMSVDAGNTLEIASASSAAISFSGTTGTLKLDDSPSFTGTVAGMSANDTIDFTDLNFGTIATPSFAGSSSAGTLTVTDGSHTANIALLGNYLASTFVASSDGHGGTLVVDPPLAQQTILAQHA